LQAANAVPVAWLYEELNRIMGYHLDPTGDFEAALSDAMRIAEAAAGPQPAPVPPGQGPPAQSGMATAGASANGSGG
jgi:hypothetical protein